LGIEERVKLAGGTLHRLEDNATFRLRAWLPLPLALPHG
jgi:signal transduction histidine kinase